jgi:hypothetical protein
MIDPAAAAILGFALGGLVSVVTNQVANRAAAKRESDAFIRRVGEAAVQRTREAYEFILNCLINIHRDGSPDRTSYGTMYAHVVLMGSQDLRELLLPFLQSRVPEQRPSLGVVEEAMRVHLASLEARLATDPAGLMKPGSQYRHSSGGRGGARHHG